ncbi:hypothetical protein [Streptomyces litmocidini]|uniref:hypothetical protein n=1 Tax=Streptomyces litmocidini TaxID=67318 RepID=UPI0036FF253E
MTRDDGGRTSAVIALVRGAFLVDAVHAEAGGEHGPTPQQGRWLRVLVPGPKRPSASGRPKPERELPAELLGRIVRDDETPAVLVDAA